jgi:hypothetical protein
MYVDSMKVIQYLGRYGALRQFAEDMFKEIEASTDSEVELDFTGIEFIGRGCAHECFVRMKKSKKTFTLINQNKDVAYMFYIVEHPRPKAHFPATKVINLNEILGVGNLECNEKK